MSIFSFDYYNQNEIPNFSLANPDGSILYNMGTIFNRKLNLRYNAISELTFTVPSQIDGKDVDFYDSIQYRRLVLVNGIANFMITSVNIENNGLVETKTVGCKSLEIMMANKKLTLMDNSFKFYDPTDVPHSLMDTILEYLPGWSIGTIDNSLKLVYRYFEISDKTIYDFLMNEVSQTYQCIFIFDSIAKTISAHSVLNATIASDIFISFENLMKSFTIEEITDELATALTVVGGENLEINLVNPIGTSTIYNFDYYKNLDWMTSDLIWAIDRWEDEIAYWQPTYSDLLTDLYNENLTIVGLQSTLAGYQAELAALYVERDAAIAAKATPAEMAVINANIDSKLNQISNTQASIDVHQLIANDIQAQTTAITQELSFANNFTQTQLTDLDNFVIGNTYSNTNFIQTSIMTPDEIQATAQELYDQGVVVLTKISQPRYVLDIEAANFLFIKEFEPFINQLTLGCTITVEIKEDIFVYPALIGIDFNYDDPTDFKMILSNRMRMDNQEFQYSDLFSSMVDSSTTTNFNSQKWNSVSGKFSGSQIGGVVLASSVSQENNMALYYDASGVIIKDEGAKYFKPTEFVPMLSCEGTTSFGYNFNNGAYSILGRTFFFEVSISLSSITGASACPVYIEMPAYPKTIPNLYIPFATANGGVTTGSLLQLVGILSPASSKIGLWKKSSTGAALTQVLGTALGSSTTVIHMSGSYFLD